MRKIFCFLALSSLALTSCSSSDDSNSSAANGLLKKTIETDSEGNVVTSNYSYNGHKIKKVEDSTGERTEFTYSGDLITKIQYFYDDGGLEQTNLYTYDSAGKLVMFQRLEPDDQYGAKEMYVYNSNGTVSVTRFIGDATSQTEDGGTATVYFQNGEVSEIDSDSGGDLLYTYDNKNNPGKDITGFGAVTSFADLGVSGINHNLLSDDGTYTYTYNDAGYPVTSTENFSGDVTSTQYFYN
ncbi:MAG: hypothetical protein EOO48_09745 [Flavobacterium sp.]|nr:MAG: hypothetical protein EOO48_09745 [Flavobacterium sp.]